MTSFRNHQSHCSTYLPLLYILGGLAKHLCNRILLTNNSGPNHGHYICIVKSQSNWLQFDDEEVDLIPEELIQRCFGCTKDVQHNIQTGYILFYQQREPHNSCIGWSLGSGFVWPFSFINSSGPEGAQSRGRERKIDVSSASIISNVGRLLGFSSQHLEIKEA